MKSLLIIGAGGYGQLVKEIAEMIGYKKIDFLDDNSREAIGKINEIEEIEGRYGGSIVAIGNPEIREKIFERLKKPITLIHPKAVVSKSAAVGAGCVIEVRAVVSANAEVKRGTFICAGAIVNHNSVVGEFAQLDCNAVVACENYVPDGYKVHSCTEYRKSQKAVGGESFF